MRIASFTTSNPDAGFAFCWVVPLALLTAVTADARQGVPCPDCQTPFRTPVRFEASEADRDGDGIPDEEEQRLLNMYAPQTYGSVIYPPYEDPGGAPVSVSWMLRNSCRVTSPWIDDPDFIYCWETMAQWRADVAAGQGGCGWWLRLDQGRQGGWHPDPAERRSWYRATQIPEHTYGRAWKPWPRTHPNLVSLQYYAFYTSNDADAPGGEGDHRGDWGAIDLTVDLEADAQKPPVLHMIYHNHGRQFFMTPESFHGWKTWRPVMFLERGSNEPWPNMGEGGFDGWPETNGFATNRWDNESWMSQHHLGNGYLIDWRVGGRDIPNIGDNGVSLCGEEGAFLQEYSGRWGDWVDGGLFHESSNPRSSVQQKKVVNRCWTVDGGPWQSAWTDGEPFVYPAGSRWVLTREPATWTMPIQMGTVYVDGDLQGNQGKGWVTDPYAPLPLGIAMVLRGGTVRLVRPSGTGTALFRPIHITKPLTLDAVGGPITLGAPIAAAE